MWPLLCVPTLDGAHDILKGSSTVILLVILLVVSRLNVKWLSGKSRELINGDGHPKGEEAKEKLEGR